MARTYHFKGGYIQITNEIKNNYRISSILHVLLLVLIFLLVLRFTDYIFFATLSTRDYFDIISLGAVFATIGSSLISITSLFCNYLFEEYQKAKEILLSYNDNIKTANTWNFIEDNKVLLKSAEQIIAYKKVAPEIVFEFGVGNLSVPIPINKKDLLIGPLIKNFIQMKIIRNLYFKRLKQNSSSLEDSGLFVWECTTYMLSRAIFYKISLTLTILGGMFFIAGLIATFIHS